MLTVFTSCHNQAAYLPAAIESVLRQTHSEFVYHLIDDGSTDNTWDTILTYAEKDDRIEPIRLTKQPNVGPVINMSLRNSEDYWVWCPSDDELHPDLLEKKLDFSKEFPNAVIYDDWYTMDSMSKKLVEKHVPIMTPCEFNQEVWKSSPIGFTGIWLPVAVIKTLNHWFPEHLLFSEDFYWMIEATLLGIQFIGYPEILHMKRKHTNTTTSKNISAILAQIPIIRQELAEKYNVNQ